MIKVYGCSDDLLELDGAPYPADESREYDGCSTHSICKYCGEKIMQDSQGNWF